jgi:hypothetical protein
MQGVFGASKKIEKVPKYLEFQARESVKGLNEMV